MKKLYQCPDCNAIYLRDTDTNKDYWQPLSCFEQSALFIMLRSTPLMAIIGVVQVIKTTCCDSCHFLNNPITHTN